MINNDNDDDNDDKTDMMWLAVVQDHHVTLTSFTPGGRFLLSNGTLCSTDKSKGCRHCSVTSTPTLPQISICCLSSLWSRRPLQTQIPLIGQPQCCWTRWRLRRGGSSLSDAAEIMSWSSVLSVVCCGPDRQRLLLLSSGKPDASLLGG